MAQTFDIIIIGGGPGGYVAAIRGAQLGKKVALVEEKHLGGICLNWGCIPTKALLRTAEVHHLASHAQDFGLKELSPKADWKAVIQRSRGVSETLSSGIAHLMKKNKVTVFEGRSRLKGKQGSAHQVEVKGKKSEILSAPKVIVATGARARELPGLKPDGDRIWTYREAMIAPKQPKSLIVVGSGAIGVEFASFYAEMGTDVTVVEVQDRILPVEDAEISAVAHKAFEKRGIQILTSTTVKNLKPSKTSVEVTFEGKKGSKTAKADHVLLAVGIAPNTENLGLESTKIKMDRGHIQVDGFAQTSEPGIYAIGDVAGAPWLAHKASHEGVIAVEHAFSEKGVHPLNASNIPGCTYSSPQIASVGLTEEAAQKAGHKIKVGRFPAMGNGKALALGEADEGLVKVIFHEETGELLGAHMIGPEVTEQIQGFVLARTLEATEADIMNTVFPHPTLSEMMHEATLAAFGKAIHI
ncbi:MAG: dihydrolipoyl dehydrogenase [bacterium]|nr:dihydrolipoyl dehydrogenase [bacterium]